MVPFSINASTSLFFIFRQNSLLLSFIWILYCCFLPSKWDQNGLLLGTKKFGEHSPNSVVLLHFAAEIAYCCFHLLHRQKKPRRVHASAKRYQILASNSDGVNATTFLTTDQHSSNNFQYQYALKCCAYSQKFSFFQFIYFICGSFSIPFD